MEQVTYLCLHKCLLSFINVFYFAIKLYIFKIFLMLHFLHSINNVWAGKVAPRKTLMHITDGMDWFQFCLLLFCICDFYFWISEMVECDSIPCQNNGSCSDVPLGYDCACMAGYNSTNCENGTPINFYWMLYQLT